MTACDRCGMSGIGLATHGHGEPCQTTTRQHANAARYESALKDISELGPEYGGEWCQRRARRALEREPVPAANANVKS